jgi:competence protein ComEA
VDINHASKNELMNLHNVGAAKADAIINYRDQKCFDSVEELVKVKGIGQGILESNKEELTLSACKK